MDWPSGSTVIPPLFDGHINITATSSNQDYGYFNNPVVNKAIDAADLISDADARERPGHHRQEDQRGRRSRPPGDQKLGFGGGSKVKGYTINSAFGGYVDFATLAAQ